MLRPHVATFLDVASAFRHSSDLDLEIEQLQIGSSSPLISNTLEQLRISSKYGVIVLAVQRKNGVMQFNPAADLHIEPGDVLIAMGERLKLKRLEQEMRTT
jgi:K+/H+ antiporter YhaU regulatory subunit KhtT